MSKQSTKSEYLLAAVIISRATSLLLSKLSMRSLEPFNLMALRFLTAFALLAVLFSGKWKFLRPVTILRGALLGSVFFLVMTFELMGLRATDSSTTSFIENCAIVWVPLLTAFLHKKRPAAKTVLCAGLALCGVALLTIGKNGFSIGYGEVFCLLASFFYSAAIILTAELSKKDDSLMLGILQVGFIGVYALAATALFESPHMPATGSDWISVLYLAVVCSGFGFTLQPVAQKHVSAERASLFCALNPLTACILGIVFLHESLRPAGLAGCGLILGGILAANLPSGKIMISKRHRYSL